MIRKIRGYSMAIMVRIETIEEYNYIKSMGHEPLLLDKYFDIEIGLRKRLQCMLFARSLDGRGNDITASNERFYRWIWDNKPHYCEECMRPLREYSSTYCSHILSRGAFPDMAYDPRNVNILCKFHHDMWETGKRETMRIYKKNTERMKILRYEYSKKDRGL